MIDLHCHILPGLDDGAPDWDEALAMAQVAADDGTRVLAATPHTPANPASLRYSPAEVRTLTDELNRRIGQAGIDLTVVAATELSFESGLVESLNRGRLLPFGTSRAVLLEVMGARLPASFANAVFALQVAGYRVLMAHPERLLDVQNDPNVLLPLIERGMLTQITAVALTGHQGERYRQTAETLLLHGMAHIIASDAHSAAGRRPPILSDARDRAAALIGAPRAQAMVETTPRALLNQTPIQLPAPRRAPRR